MPGAGFYPIHTEKLSFRSDGRWYADDEPVVHERLALLFSRYVRRKPAGGYEIWIDERYHADVEIEDTPFVVTGVDCQANQFHITLNDGSTELLDPESLRIGRDNVVYCSVKTGSEPARMLRNAYYQLTHCLEEVGGQYQLRCGERSYVIRSV